MKVRMKKTDLKIWSDFKIHLLPGNSWKEGINANSYIP